jgi:phosphatidylglycerol:prolipoprotein diacylglycerol transferase
MYPILELPLVGAVRSHSVLILLAVAAAASLGFRQAVRAGLPPRTVLGAILLIALATFAAGRLHFALAHWDLFRSRPWRVFSPSSSGLHAPGAMAGAALSAMVVLKWLAIPLGRFADALAPAAAVGVALARVGCFLHGCCFGKVCRYPWGVRFPDEELVRIAQVAEGALPEGARESLPAHPLQLYFAGAALAIGLFLLWLNPRKRYEGQVGLVFLLLFFASSAALEPLRADVGPQLNWGPVPQLLWIGALLAAICAAVLILAEAFRWFRRTRSV